MIGRHAVINRLKEAGYRFKRDAWRVSFFKKGTHLVGVPKRDLIEEDWVRSQFHQCGLTRDEVEHFIKCARS